VELGGLFSEQGFFNQGNQCAELAWPLEKRKKDSSKEEETKVRKSEGAAYLLRSRNYRLQTKEKKKTKKKRERP